MPSSSPQTATLPEPVSSRGTTLAGARVHVALGLAMAGVYLVFPNRFYTFDALSYAADVREASLLFHPHHLLYSAFCWVVWRGASLIAPVDTLALMAVLSALTTGAAIGIVHSTLRRLEVAPTLALGGALLLAVSYGPWFTGTTAEVYGFSLLLEAAAFRTLLEVAPDRRAPAAIACVLVALAMLFHQTSIFLLPPAAWLVAKRARSWRAGLAFAVAALLLVAIPYAGIGIAQGRTSVARLVRWVLHYTHGTAYAAGRWGRVSWENVPQAFAGIGGTFLFPRAAVELFAGATFRFSAEVIATFVLGVVALVQAVLLIVRRVRAGTVAAPAVERDAIRALVGWLALRAVFSLWWEPANLEWWLLVELPGVLLLGFWLSRGRDAGKRTAPVLLAAVAVLAVGNFALRVLPDSVLANNEPFWTLHALQRQGLGARDLVVGDRVELIPYGRYFANQTLSMATLTSETYATPADRDATIRRFRERILQAREHGRVWVLESELDPSRDVLMLYPQWRREDYERCYAPLRPRLVARARYRANGRPGRIFALR